MSYLPYNPGEIPTKPPPSNGDFIKLRVGGFPPIKNKGISLRNPSNPKYERFVLLRDAATKAMENRAWYFGPIELNLEVFYTEQVKPEVSLTKYEGGVMDTLDGNSGVNYTYLPIVYEDDCQVCQSRTKFILSKSNFYTLEVKFL